MVPENFFFNFVNVFSLFRNYLPLEKGETNSFNNLDFSSPKDALYQAWLKLGQRSLTRRFLNFVNVFSLFPNYLLLEKSVALHFNKLEYPLHKEALCQVWLKLAKWPLRRRFLNFLGIWRGS